MATFKIHFLKITFFFLLTISISGVGYILVTNQMENTQNISQFINIAGRQRMLIESINKKAIQMVYMNDTTTKKDLIAQSSEFEKELHSLMYGNEELNLAPLQIKNLNSHLIIVKKLWNSLKLNLDEIIIGNNYQAYTIQRIDKKSAEMIRQLEIVVQLIETQSTQNFQGLAKDNLLIIGINLLFIIMLLFAWGLLSKLSKSEKRYRLLVDHSPLGIMIYKDKNIHFINNFAAKALGYSNKKEILGKLVFTFVHPDYHQTINSRINQIHEHNQVLDLVEEKFIRKDGTTIFVEVMGIPFQVMGEKTVMAIFRDITEQKQSENKFEHIYNELKDIRMALEISSVVEITDNSGKLLYVNENFCKVSQFAKEELIGKTSNLVNSNYHTKEFFQDLWGTIQDGRVWEGQVRNRAKDGTVFWLNKLIIPFINDDGQPYQHLAISYDITDAKNAETEIQKMAIHDPLTNLPNRRKFERELLQVINDEESVAILFIDLDRFKYVNDSLGHSAGDDLIRLVAKRLKKIVGSKAIVSRQGGDEFTILYPYKDKASISYFAKKITQEIKKPFIIQQKEILITCSIGISLFPENGHDIETLMKNADVAMYWSKDNGKDHFSFYQDHMKETSAKIMKLEWELRKAVENQEFILHYQPKIDLNTDMIVGCEALIRWEHPTMGTVSPAEFIPLAEETGLINQIGEWVLREACRQNKKWHDAGFTEFQVAVNISVHQLKQANIVTMIKNILTETNLDARFLELEMTESISMLNDKNEMEKLYAIKKLGVSLAIDDFGTGYSSLKYLDKLPVDTLKIDKTFIDEIGRTNHNKSSTMLNAIISLANSLKLKVVAEGIETTEQLQYLKKNNCNLGQGYLISKPVPAEQLQHLIKTECLSPRTVQH